LETLEIRIDVNSIPKANVNVIFVFFIVPKQYDIQLKEVCARNK